MSDCDGRLSIAALIPPAVALAERWGTDLSGGCAGAAFGAPFPEEARTLGRVSAVRRQEFAAGRTCARQAMQKLGVRPQPLLRGRERQPLWPAALCGSITHCRGYCAAVVARTRDMRTIGIDAEPIREFDEVVLDRIARAGERTWILGADAQTPWAVLLFSAKESVFKAWFQVFESALDFQHAHIDFDPPRRAFRAIVERGIGGRPGAVPFIGRYHFDRERVLTSAYLEVDAPAILERTAGAPQK